MTTTSHPPEARRGTCRSCDAAILWAKTSTGRAIPLDLEPSERGNVEFTGVLDIVKVHASSSDDLLGTLRWMPHHATCPQAAEWRRRG